MQDFRSDETATRLRMAHVPARDADVPRYDGGWPAIERQLIILFTSRVGSSLLCRHIEKTREVSGVGEAFNRVTLEATRRRTGAATLGDALAADVARASERGWFVAKAGYPGLAVAERLGYIEHTIARTDFWFLLRRDVIAQAISSRIGNITGRFHSTQQQQRPVCNEDYDEALLVKRTRAIIKNCRGLLDYARASGRPLAMLVYEDFAEGDFTRPDRLLDLAGVPRREAPLVRPRPDLEPLRYPQTALWAERLRTVPDVERLLQRYARLLQEIESEFGRS